MTFGEKLRAARKKCGLTQAELAQKAKVGLKTISNYENGLTYPQNREVYTVLADILGIDVYYLKNENDEFVDAVEKKYGYRGKKQAMELVEEMSGLFAGGELSDEDLDGVMKVLQDYYWKAKEDNKKYTPNKYRNDKE